MFCWHAWICFEGARLGQQEYCVKYRFTATPQNKNRFPATPKAISDWLRSVEIKLLLHGIAQNLEGKKS